MAVTCCSKLPV